MASQVTLYDHEGNVIDLSRLRREEGGPSLATIRSPMQEHPSWGLTPDSLGGLLRQTESVDPSRWFALAADIEEREWHYRGVLSTRKSDVAQLPIEVKPADDSAESAKHADLVRAIVERPDFTLTLINILDALGKGASWTEIVWDTSESQWMPADFKWRDQRWFRLDQNDLTTPLLINEGGMPQPLAPYKWICHYPHLLSGLPIRSGLTRAAAWAWMFKNFNIKAWAIFLEAYGHPLRLGKYPASATYEERQTLLNAVVRLGVDNAAIIPEGMGIELVAAAAGSQGAAFKDMAEYLDDQVTKLVLGQVATTEARAGGHGSAMVQNYVREDIERFDSLMLSATLNRDLSRPAVDLNFGPQKKYPTIRIGRPEEKDVQLIFENLGNMVDRGLKIATADIYPLFGLKEPAPDAELLQPAKPAPQAGASSVLDPSQRAAGDLGADDAPPIAAATPPNADRADTGTPDAIDALADEMGGDMSLLADIQKQIEQAIDQSSSFDELLARIEGLAKGPLSQKLVDKLAYSMFNARLAAELGAPLADAGA